MKKLIAVLLSIVMLFGLSACGYGASVTADMEESGETAAEEDTSDETAVSENGVMASGILIAYFSKTGNTEEVANRIQELTGGDLFRIETAQPYPEDYTETTQIAQEELENNARPELTGEVENMEDYDTLFIGYPIWWHTAPMAVYTFLESYDLSGKTVIPFCTSGGSDIEESMPAIQELCPDSNILEGLTANNLDDVEPWIESLGVVDGGETETEAASSTDSNILIAYFSLPEDIDTEGIDADAGASVVVDDGEVKGNVQYMAEIIQETIGGDLFRIQTEETYPGDHDPLVDQAAQEQDEQARPALSAHIENLDQYDTILLGYPNWWADLPQPLYTFLEEYDLSGKTIIPFNSHNGSRFSNTIETIQELQPNATVIEDGFTINERDVPEAAEDVAQWLQGLGY